MPFKITLLALLCAGCAAKLPASLERKHPAHPSHSHQKIGNILHDYQAFKPVQPKDWREVNREVAPR